MTLALDIRCWRCNRALVAELEGEVTSLRVILVCSRCRAKNAIAWPVNTSPVTLASGDLTARFQ